MGLERRRFLAAVGASAFAQCRDASAQDHATLAGQTHWVTRGPYRLFLWEKSAGEPAGKPVVVLAHGSGTSSRESFDLQVPEGDYSLMDQLARAGFDVFASDVHGFGRSSWPSGYVTTEGAAEDLEAVVRYVRSVRAVARVHVLAWSWGTQYAGLFVAAHPEWVDRYVSYAQMHAGSADIARRRARLDFYRTTPWSTIPREGWKARFSSNTPPGLTDPAVLEAFADAAAATETRTNTGPQLDMVTRLPMVDPEKIVVPTLLIHGEFDDVADPAGLLPFFAALSHPDRRYVIIPKAGHMMHFQAGRQRFVEAVLDFLRGGEVTVAP